MATKEEVCARIKEIGILPAIRVPSAEDALFAAGEMLKWGIPVVELTMTVPGAIGRHHRIGAHQSGAHRRRRDRSGH